MPRLSATEQGNADVSAQLEYVTIDGHNATVSLAALRVIKMPIGNVGRIGHAESSSDVQPAQRSGPERSVGIIGVDRVVTGDMNELAAHPVAARVHLYQ